MSKKVEKEKLTPLRNAWGGPPLPILRELEVEVCRCDIRVSRMQGAELAFHDDDTHSAATMAFLFVGRVFEFVREHREADRRPRFNQVEAHLELDGHGLRRVRLSDCFEGRTRNKADIGQARESLRYLLLGYPLVGQVPAPDKQSDDDRERLEIHRRIDRFLFREDGDGEGPRFLLPERRPHPAPCSATELQTEVERIARKRRHGLATEAKLVWVLGGSSFPRADLIGRLPESVALSLAAGVEVTFVYTDTQPEGWGLNGRRILPSRSVSDLERSPTAERKKCQQANVGDDGHWSAGDWAFLSPCNQYIYLKANSREPDEILYVLRGHDELADKNTVPIALRANKVELAAFLEWLKVIRRKAGLAAWD